MRHAGWTKMALAALFVGLVLTSIAGCEAESVSPARPKLGPALKASRWDPGTYAFTRLVDLQRADVTFNKDGTVTGGTKVFDMPPIHYGRWTEGSYKGDPVLVLSASSGACNDYWLFPRLKDGKLYLGGDPGPALAGNPDTARVTPQYTAAKKN
jgi:hypothetical protein